MHTWSTVAAFGTIDKTFHIWFPIYLYPYSVPQCLGLGIFKTNLPRGHKIDDLSQEWSYVQTRLVKISDLLIVTQLWHIAT